MNLTLSHSQVNKYNECKYKWKLQYIDGWQAKDTDAMNRGTFIHDVLNKFYYLGSVDKTKQYMTELFKESPSTEKAQYLRLLERYFDEFSPAEDRGQTTLALEQKFLIDFTSLAGRTFQVTGYIDRVYTKNNCVVIEDFKTLGSAKWWDEISLALDMQTTTYAALLPHATGLDTVIHEVNEVAVTQINCYPYKNNGMESKPYQDLFRRQTAYRTDAEKKNILIEFGNIADEMLDHLERKLPFNKALTKNCSKCNFNEACKYSLKGIEVEPFLNQGYTKKETELAKLYYTEN